MPVRRNAFRRKPDNFRLKAVLQTFKTSFEMPSNCQAQPDLLADLLAIQFPKHADFVSDKPTAGFPREI